MLKRWKKITSAVLAAAMVVPTVLSAVGPLAAQAAQTAENTVVTAELTDKGTEAPAAWGVTPNSNQYEYQKQELAAFCHFGLNTFNDREWGTGDELDVASNFKLANDFDAETLVSSLKNAGFKKLIVTAKHHDGFCIWRSQYTDFDLENTIYKGDVLAEISAACTKYNIDMGLYLSPWDMNSEAYGYRDENGNATDKDHDAKDYNEYYNNQLQEILGNDKYGNAGHFKEVWMDGAKGAGFMAQDYDFDKWFDTIQKNEGRAAGYDSDCMLFGAGIHSAVFWIGNESGYAMEETWSKCMVDAEKNSFKRGPNDVEGSAETMGGFPEGNQWVVPEVDAKISSGWFWGTGNHTPLTEERLSQIYFDSVGHGATLLLNVPPNTEGTVDQAMLDRVAELGNNINDTFVQNMAAAEGATITASAVRGDDIAYSPENLLDDDDDTYWTMDDGATTGSLTIDLGSTRTFDVVSLEEAIQLGQRVSEFSVEYQNQGGDWKTFAEGTTIGPKKLCRKTPVKADKVRINIDASYAVPVINAVGIYKASEGFELAEAIPDGIENIDIKDTDVSDGTGFTMTGTWNQETGSQYTNQTNMYANASNAQPPEVTMKFHGTKAWVIGTLDPKHGTADIYLDGAETPTATIDTNRTARSTGQKIYETPDLSDGDHTIRLVVKSNAIGIEALLALDNGGKGMFEMEQSSYSVPEDTVNEFVVRRVGGSAGEAKVTFQDQPGTAVQSHYLPTKGTELTFAEGETEKTVTVTTKRQPLNTGDVYFFIEVVNPTDGAIVGFNERSRVTIIDSDKITKEILSALVESTASLIQDNYVQEGWEALTEAKAAAQAQINSGSATTATIKKAYDDLKAAIDGLQVRGAYSAEDPFVFPSYKGQQKNLEAEFFELDPTKDKYVRIDEVADASNGHMINWFEEGNKIILHYTAEKAGTYNLTARYKSGRASEAANPNAFVWSGTNITSGSQDVYGEENATTYHTAVLPIEITKAGAGDLIFTADAKAGPMIDNFTVEPNEIEYAKFNMAVTVGEHGTVSDSDITEVYQGASQKFVIVPDPTYKISDVKANGESVKAQLVLEDEATGAYSYTFTDIQQDSTLEAEFEFSGYSEAAPFVMPVDGTAKTLEAEYFTLEPITGDKYIRIGDNPNASNGKELNWFETGNKIILPYTAEKAGTYTFTARYRSGRSASSPNAFEWSGDNIISGVQDVYGSADTANDYKTIDFEVVITKAGAGKLIFTAGAKAGPPVDKFDIKLKSDTIQVSGVTLDKATATMTEAGETVQLTASVLPEAASNKAVTWTSSKESVATVDENGLVTAVAAGTTDITVTTVDQEQTAVCKVTVNITVPATGVTLDKTEAKMTSKGGTLQLTASVAPENATNKNVSWKSSKTNVATVGQGGMVTAVGNGTTTITATTADGSFTASCEVTVEIIVTEIAVTGVEVAPAEATLTSAGATLQLTPTVLPADASNKTVSYTSSNTEAATVDESGLVTAAANGTTVITVKTEDGDFEAKSTITVEIPVPVTGVTLAQKNVTLTNVGEKANLNAAVVPENATNKKLTWTSSKPQVASVDENGVVTAVTSGEATITVKTEDGGFQDTALVKVSIQKKVTGITLDKSSCLLTSKGQKEKLNAVVSPADAADKTVTWKSSNTAVAVVGQDGTVTAAANGKATITVTTRDGGLTASCIVEVKIPTVVKPGRVSDVRTSKNTVSSMKISWKAVSGADSYRVYKKASGGKWALAGTVRGTSLTIRKLTAGTKYYVKVAAVQNGVKGSYSKFAISAAKPKKVALKPVRKYTKNSVKLTYPKVKATGYVVYKKLGNGSYSKVGGTTKKTTVKIKGLKNGKTYSFKVRAYVKAGGKTYYGSYSKVRRYTVR